MARQVWKSGRLVLLVALFTLLFGSVARPESLDQDLATAKDLEQSIRDSDNLALLTKLGIQIRFERIKSVRAAFDRGEVPERHLKLAFDSTFSWLESVFAEAEPMLRVRLLRARPALWRVATAAEQPISGRRRTVAAREWRENR